MTEHSRPTRLWQPEDVFRCAVLMLTALLHGYAYMLLVPLWQAPDEPLLYEYAALTAELGRAAQVADRSPQLEARLAESLARHDFWFYRVGERLPDPPATIEAVQARFPMPRQVEGDPPLYFGLAALPLRLAASWPIDQQALLLRALNVLLLPLVVLCTYAAARELAPAQPLLAAAAGVLVALLPMFAAIGGSLGNDTLANAIGAALCWALLRAARDTCSPRALVAAALLLTLGLLTKRTLVPYVPLVALVASAWLLRSRQRRVSRLRGTRLALAGLPIVALVAWLAWEHDPRTVAWWYDTSTWRPAQRAGGALQLEASDEVGQPLPAALVDRLQGRTLRFGARVWSDQPASGSLVVYTSAARPHEISFAVNGTARVETSASIPTSGQRVIVALRADAGQFYADDLWSAGADLPGNLLRNGTLSAPGPREGALLPVLANYLRLPDLAWRLRYGLPGLLPAIDNWLPVVFASFWGHFGWMDVAFVLGTGWEAVLVLVCLASLIGIAWWWARGRTTRAQQVQVLLLLLTIATGLATLLLNGHIQPYNQSLQQGRYLFPLLTPIAIVLTLGQHTLATSRWQRIWFVAWCSFWAVFAAAALLRLQGFYS